LQARKVMSWFHAVITAVKSGMTRYAWPGWLGPWNPPSPPLPKHVARCSTPTTSPLCTLRILTDSIDIRQQCPVCPGLNAGHLRVKRRPNSTGGYLRSEIRLASRGVDD
jgi:hypothetical protein